MRTFFYSLNGFIALSLYLLYACCLANETVVGAYYENYSTYYPPSEKRSSFNLKQLPPALVSDLYIAFGSFGYVSKGFSNEKSGLTNHYTILPTDQRDLETLYPTLGRLKQSNPQLKTLLVIGGWNFNNPQDPQGNGQLTYRLFSQMVAEPSYRAEFIQSAIQFAKHYSFDGFEIDWEYPGDLTRGGSVNDFENLQIFLKECSEAFSKIDPPLILSYAAPAFVPKAVTLKNNEEFFAWLAKCSPYLHRITLMCYDYHGPFNESKLTGANAPLKKDTHPNSLLYIEHTLTQALKAGVPADKIILGIPTFGHSFAGVDFAKNDYLPGRPFQSAGPPGPSTQQKGLLAYYEIADLIQRQKLNFAVDPTTQTAIAYNSALKQWISFDTPETTKLKAELAKKKNLKGIVFWSLNMDEYQWDPRFPNIQSGKKAFQ